MGRQARLKRARRAGRMRYQPTTGSRLHGMLLWIAIAALVALAAALAVLVGRGGDDAPAGMPEPAAVGVEGRPLPGFDSVAGDAAVGQPAPVLVGTSAAGDRVTIPGAESPYVVIFLAHWCPHCQREVPLIVDWIRESGAPRGVNVYSVATANDPSRPNYPATAWLESEGWQPPVLVDDERGAAAEAYGVTGFPFFVFVGADGNVVARHAGELAIDELAGRLDVLAEEST